MKNDSALFYTCSLIEYIGRIQKQRRSEVVKYLGKSIVKRIYDYADVFHCEPIEKTADEFISRCKIPKDSYDNVSACRYEVPDYWTIGEVYERLIEDISDDNKDSIIEHILEVYLHGLVMQYQIIIRILFISHGNIYVDVTREAEYAHRY